MEAGASRLADFAARSSTASVIHFCGESRNQTAYCCCCPRDVSEDFPCCRYWAAFSEKWGRMQTKVKLVLWKCSTTRATMSLTSSNCGAPTSRCLRLKYASSSHCCQPLPKHSLQIDSRSDAGRCHLAKAVATAVSKPCWGSRWAVRSSAGMSRRSACEYVW